MINSTNIPRAPVFLKTSLDILLLFLMLGVIGSSLIGGYYLFAGKTLPIQINGVGVTEFSTVAAICTILMLLSNFIFIFIIWNFRKLVRLFFKRKLFTREQIAKTVLIGKLNISVALIEALVPIIYNTFGNDPLGLRISFIFGGTSFGSFWFILALGLFFIYLSRIFENARVLKEENELTI